MSNAHISNAKQISMACWLTWSSAHNKWYVMNSTNSVQPNVVGGTLRINQCQFQLNLVLDIVIFSLAKVGQQKPHTR